MLLIDGNLLAHRAFHKMDSLLSYGGSLTGMEFGFIRSLESLQVKYPGHKIILCFDTSCNKKKEKYPRYKSSRKAPKEGNFYPRLTALRIFLNNFWDVVTSDGYEADEIMFSLSRTMADTKGIYIYSNDNDLLQCVNEAVTVIKSHESNLYEWGPDKVLEKYYVAPALLPILRSLIGDSSDDLDGVARINKKCAVSAIEKALKSSFSSMEEVGLRIASSSLFSDTMQEKIREFVQSGLFAENFEIMALKVLPNEVLNYSKFEEHEDEVVRYLQEKGFNSLKLCKKYVEKLVEENTEF